MTNPFDIAQFLGLPKPPSQSADFIAGLLWSREVMQQHIKDSYQVTSPQGIEELRPVTINGSEQWLHVRGRNRENPILLYVHGGPGSTDIGFMDAIQRPWEDYFTVVQWDQRQAGKSYYPVDEQTPPLTIDGMVDDTECVIRFLLEHLDQKKLVLVGHSWGTVLGMHIAKQSPELLHAYIGIGQVVDSLEAEKLIYQRVIDYASNNGNQLLVDKLEAALLQLASTSEDERVATYMNYVLEVREQLSLFAGEALMHHQSWSKTVEAIRFSKTISPHLTLEDLSSGFLGKDLCSAFAPYEFTRERLATNLEEKLGCEFDVPILFFTGAHDWQTPGILSSRWFEQISAPRKAIIEFEDSSHVVVNEEPGRFLVELLRHVHSPLIKQGAQYAG